MEAFYVPTQITLVLFGHFHFKQIKDYSKLKAVGLYFLNVSQFLLSNSASCDDVILCIVHFIQKDPIIYSCVRENLDKVSNSNRTTFISINSSMLFNI